MSQLTSALFVALSCVPVFAALPVVPAKDQAALLKASDPKLAANKKAAYDFFRIVLRGRHLDQAEKYMKVDYMQHNPNADTGIKGFKEYFEKLGGPTDIPNTLDGLVAIQAEGDYVTLSFVREYDDPAASAKASLAVRMTISDPTGYGVQGARRVRSQGAARLGRRTAAWPRGIRRSEPRAGSVDRRSCLGLPPDSAAPRRNPLCPPAKSPVPLPPAPSRRPRVPNRRSPRQPTA